jgi:hypothetical protein
MILRQTQSAAELVGDRMSEREVLLRCDQGSPRSPVLAMFR